MLRCWPSLVNKSDDFFSSILFHAPDIVLGCKTWLNGSFPNTHFTISDYIYQTLYISDYIYQTTYIRLHPLLPWSLSGPWRWNVHTGQIQPQHVHGHFRFCSFIDSIWAQLFLKDNNILIVWVIYRPRSSCPDSDYNITAFCADITILCGDTNIPMVSWRTHSGLRRYGNLLATI